MTAMAGAPASREATVQAAFYLAGAEGRLASRLASGHTLEPSSDILMIAKQTARNQLTIIFCLDGVWRQAEPVALAANLFWLYPWL
jgi:hypothetical protein